MNYYIDTEFHEYKKKPLIGKAIDTIELISIGLISEDDREYYAICNEFDIKAAWSNDWLKVNVLIPIYKEWTIKEGINTYYKNYTYKGFKNLIKNIGKSKKQIAEEVKDFTKCKGCIESEKLDIESTCKTERKFYAYYGDYDWVVFCWLFGRMIDLPKCFPMYCIDLKQELDNKLATGSIVRIGQTLKACELVELRALKTLEERLNWIKKYSKVYPKQSNEHNALDDAKWNKELHEFIKSI